MSLDDLDSLLEDLGGGKPKPAPAPVDDLDALMNELGSPAPAAAPAKKHAPPAGPPPAAAPPKKAAPVDDLDDLMSELSSPPPAAKPAPAAAPPAAKPAAKPAATSDLDDLMSELSSPAPAAKPAPAAAKPASGMDDLDALMNDLGGAKPAAQPAAKPAAKPAPAKASGMDDLDSLMADLGTAQPARGGGGGGGGGGGAPPAARPAAGGGAAPARVDPKLAGANDLDAVMRALSGAAPAPAAGPQGRSLDSILSNLTQDMDRMGVSSDYKGTCAACMKPIIGQVVTALGQSWHSEHFACVKCRTPLGSTNFFEKDGRPYCERDYHELFSARCAYCNGPILDQCINALNKTWHPDHFFCAHCGKSFENSGFLEYQGKAYCEEDYFALYAPKCAAPSCGNPIMDACITALGSQWHPDCFVCTTCKKGFGTGSFFEVESLPYCEICYHGRQGSLCGGCQQPITGRCLTAIGKRWHPEHFVCAFCMKQLASAAFKEQQGKCYCTGCHIKLFG